MKIAASLLLVAALLSASPAFARGGTRLHIDVHDKDGTSATVDVPFSLAKAALSVANRSSIDVSAGDADVAKMREAWREMRRAGETASMTTHDDDDDVVIEATRDLVRIDVTHRGAKKPAVRIRLPSDAVDALLGGEGDSLDVAAALQKIADAPKGDVVSVDDDGDRVRIWFE